MDTLSGVPLLDRMAAVTDPVRCRVLRLLDGQELTVSELCSVLQLPQSTVSRHLKTLLDEEWVVSRRDGTSRYYSMSPESVAPGAADLWNLLRDQVAASPAAHQDDRRLASVMAKRGKELLDQGDTAGGYAYLQQARSLDPVNVLPSVTLRSVNIAVDPGSGFPRLSGDVWNPGPNAVRFLTLKVDLWNTVTQKVMWEREQKLIDEFVPPLAPQETKPFDVMAGIPVKDDGKTEFRVYLDGGLYKAYSLRSGKAADPRADDRYWSVDHSAAMPQRGATRVLARMISS